MQIIEDYFSVKGSKSIPGVKMEAKIRRTFDNGREVLREKVDDSRSACFEFCRNYGNRLYTTREAGNKLYSALADGKIEPVEGCLPTFALLNAAVAYLQSIGAEYRVGCCRERRLT